MSDCESEPSNAPLNGWAKDHVGQIFTGKVPIPDITRALDILLDWCMAKIPFEACQSETFCWLDEIDEPLEIGFFVGRYLDPKKEDYKTFCLCLAKRIEKEMGKKGFLYSHKKNLEQILHSDIKKYLGSNQSVESRRQLSLLANLCSGIAKKEVSEDQWWELAYSCNSSRMAERLMKCDCLPISSIRVARVRNGLEFKVNEDDLMELASLPPQRKAIMLKVLKHLEGIHEKVASWEFIKTLLTFEGGPEDACAHYIKTHPMDNPYEVYEGDYLPSMPIKTMSWAPNADTYGLDETKKNACEQIIKTLFERQQSSNWALSSLQRVDEAFREKAREIGVDPEVFSRYRDDRVKNGDVVCHDSGDEVYLSPNYKTGERTTLTVPMLSETADTFTSADYLDLHANVYQVLFALLKPFGITSFYAVSTFLSDALALKILDDGGLYHDMGIFDCQPQHGPISHGVQLLSYVYDPDIRAMMEENDITLRDLNVALALLSINDHPAWASLQDLASVLKISRWATGLPRLHASPEYVMSHMMCSQERYPVLSHVMFFLYDLSCRMILERQPDDTFSLTDIQMQLMLTRSQFYQGQITNYFPALLPPPFAGDGGNPEDLEKTMDPSKQFYPEDGGIAKMGPL